MITIFALFPMQTLINFWSFKLKSLADKYSYRNKRQNTKVFIIIFLLFFLTNYHDLFEYPYLNHGWLWIPNTVARPLANSVVSFERVASVYYVCFCKPTFSHMTYFSEWYMCDLTNIFSCDLLFWVIYVWPNWLSLNYC